MFLKCMCVFDFFFKLLHSETISFLVRGALGRAGESVKRGRDVGGIWADFLEEETLAKVRPRGDGEECILEGRNRTMSETPEMRNWGTAQKRARDVEGEQCGFREKAMSSFFTFASSNVL